jgi:DNA-binding IclR family transcriptional regulator
MEMSTRSESTKDRHFVTALARGLQILRCFSHDRPELTPGDIVRMTGLPQPTVWRLCHTLSEAGFLVCPGDGRRMALGVPVLALGYAALVRQKLAEVALPYMRDMTERHRLGMSLSVRDGLEVVYLQRTHGDFTYFNDPVGARRPLATAPSGWACIAAYDEAELRDVLVRLKAEQGERWPGVEASLHRAFDEYRTQGFVLSVGVLHEQFNAVAVPIRPADGGPGARPVRIRTGVDLAAGTPDGDWPHAGCACP